HLRKDVVHPVGVALDELRRVVDVLHLGEEALDVLDAVVLSVGENALTERTELLTVLQDGLDCIVGENLLRGVVTGVLLENVSSHFMVSFEIVVLNSVFIAVVGGVLNGLVLVLVVLRLVGLCVGLLVRRAFDPRSFKKLS